MSPVSRCTVTSDPLDRPCMHVLSMIRRNQPDLWIWNKSPTTWVQRGFAWILVR